MPPNCKESVLQPDDFIEYAELKAAIEVCLKVLRDTGCPSGDPEVVGLTLVAFMLDRHGREMNRNLQEIAKQIAMAG